LASSENPTERPQLERTAAAIDIGTNTVLFIVGRRGPDGLEILEERCEMPRLGEGLVRGGELAGPSVERTLAVLADYHARIEAHGLAPDDCRAAGTAVLRRARHPGVLLEPARDEHGLAIEILSGEEEARLSYRGVSSEATAAGEPPLASAAPELVVDVGGGSTELVREGGSSALSVPIGAVLLSETYLGLGGAPPTQAGGWEALVAAARTALEGAVSPSPGSPMSPMTHTGEEATASAVCVGGTAVNLASLARGAAAFDPSGLEGTEVLVADILDRARALQDLDLEARRRLPIEAARAEILPAGMACLGLALEAAGAMRARLSTRGLRHGLLLEFLARRGAGPDRG